MIIKKRNAKYLLKSCYWEKTEVLKLRVFKFKTCHQVSFWGAPTHADVIEF